MKNFDMEWIENKKVNMAYVSAVSAEEAIARCRKIVDDYLVATLKAAKEGTMTAAELWDSYTSFGEDPFVVTTAGEAPVGFRAWDYARAQCEFQCGGVIPEPPKKGAENVGL